MPLRAVRVGGRVVAAVAACVGPEDGARARRVQHGLQPLDGLGEGFGHRFVRRLPARAQMHVHGRVVQQHAHLQPLPRALLQHAQQRPERGVVVQVAGGDEDALLGCPEEPLRERAQLRLRRVAQPQPVARARARARVGDGRAGAQRGGRVERGPRLRGDVRSRPGAGLSHTHLLDHLVAEVLVGA